MTLLTKHSKRLKNLNQKFSLSELDEDLDTAVRNLQELKQDAEAAKLRESAPQASVSYRAEVVDDFVRNFLVKMGMMKTLDCFQTEW